MASFISKTPTVVANGTFLNTDRLSRSGKESGSVELKSRDVVQFGVKVFNEAKKVTFEPIIGMVRLYINAEEVSGLEPLIQHHKEAYEQIIKGKETLQVHSVRFINIGIPRSGKTFFWRRLTRTDGFNILIAEKNGEKEQPSTGVVTVQKPILLKKMREVNALVKPDDWCELDDKDYATMLLEFFSQLHGDSTVENSLATCRPY